MALIKNMAMALIKNMTTEAGVFRAKAKKQQFHFTGYLCAN
jgi:hypothetical protein